MDDIEDITLSLDDTARVSNKKHVLSRKLRSTTSDEPNLTQSNIPGLETIYMKTWGCSHNSSDGEYMAGQLASFGYTITDNPEAARLWVLNSCTVKSPSEDGFVNAVRSAKDMGKEVVLAGCVPQAQKNHRALKGLSVVGVQQIDRIVEVVEETLKGNTVRLFGSKRKDGRRVGGADLALPKIRRNPLIEIIAINTGCLNHCTYCKTKQARGDLASYLPESIVARAEQSFEEGVCEIWLTSEDTGAYGRDIGSSIPELLWQLVEVIPDGAMLRLGMTNPPYILDHLEEMAKLLAHPRVYSFLHIPVQSASDSVLANMKREYTAAEFRRVVDFLKEKVPGITIATDVICGFPGETEEDFEETVQLVRDYQFPSLFINQFYPRPGTPAARMKRLPTEEVKRRTREISKVFQSYHPYDHKLGEIQEVLVTEEARDKKNYVAHNKFYEQVLVPQDDSLLGKRIRVKITETGKHYLVGKILNESATRTALSKPLRKGAVSGLAYQIRNNSTNDKNNPSLSIGLLLTAFLLGLVSIYFVI